MKEGTNVTRSRIAKIEREIQKIKTFTRDDDWRSQRERHEKDELTDYEREMLENYEGGNKAMFLALLELQQEMARDHHIDLGIGPIELGKEPRRK
jgi:hypothetical protein